MTGQRWYRTEDNRVVPEGHIEARFLIAGPGDELPEGYEIPKEYRKSVPVGERGPEQVVVEERGTVEPVGVPEKAPAKRRGSAANKQRAKTADK